MTLRKSLALIFTIAVSILSILSARAGNYWILPSNGDLYYTSDDAFPIHVEIKELTPGNYSISILTVTGIIYNQNLSAASAQYEDGEQIIPSRGQYFPSPKLTFARDLSYMYIGDQLYDYRLSKKDYLRINDVLRNNPDISRMAANATAEWAALQSEIVAGNSSSSSSASSGSKSQPQAACSLCNGTGVNPQANSGGSLQKWVAYYNKLGNKCPYCHRTSAHYHDKCPRCNVPH